MTNVIIRIALIARRIVGVGKTYATVETSGSTVIEERGRVIDIVRPSVSGIYK